MHNTKLYTPLKANVTKIKKQTPDTKTYTLEVEGGKFKFKPGQFNMVSIMGYGECPISISSSPLETETIDHTIRAVGSMTNLIDGFKEGSVLGLRGPYGNSWPVEEARGKNVLIVVGGIGLAPLRPFIYQMFGQREDFKKIQILYGARTPDDMLFTDEFDFMGNQPDTHLYLTVDKAPENRKWEHGVGVVTTLYEEADMNPANTIAVTCGPEIMMRFVCRGLVSRGF
ncbi:MAG: FAD/NAD(P)-binding protein [Vulcanimicrobiota bacterium]